MIFVTIMIICVKVASASHHPHHRPDLFFAFRADLTSAEGNLMPRVPPWLGSKEEIP